MLVVACGGGGAQSSTGPQPCSPHPCTSQNGVSVTVSNPDLWYGELIASVVGGVKFGWSIRNDTSSTLTLADDGITVLDADHHEIRDDSNDAVMFAGNAIGTPWGCTPRLTTRIPPHQTVRTQEVCVATKSAAQAAVLEFNVGAAPLDVALPASYGTSSGPCPSDQALSQAVFFGYNPSTFSDVYCKGALIAVTYTDAYGTHRPLLKQTGDNKVEAVVGEPCTSRLVIPAAFRPHLGC
jgi:hypothetical protein